MSAPPSLNMGSNPASGLPSSYSALLSTAPTAPSPQNNQSLPNQPSQHTQYITSAPNPTLQLHNAQYIPPSSAALQHPSLAINNHTPVAFDMYIPPNAAAGGPHLRNNHAPGCACCVHHHNKKDANKLLYRHTKTPSFFQSCKDTMYKTWELTKMTYWHIEPWVFRPLLAGIAYNLGIQLARIFIQYLFPSFFPTTVYFPLRANAKFYDLHNKKIQQQSTTESSSTSEVPSGGDSSAAISSSTVASLAHPSIQATSSSTLPY